MGALPHAHCYEYSCVRADRAISTIVLHQFHGRRNHGDVVLLRIPTPPYREQPQLCGLRAVAENSAVRCLFTSQSAADVNRLSYVGFALPLRMVLCAACSQAKAQLIQARFDHLEARTLAQADLHEGSVDKLQETNRQVRPLRLGNDVARRPFTFRILSHEYLDNYNTNSPTLRVHHCQE